MSRSSNFVFDDIFKIDDIDKDDKNNKKFERGTFRIICTLRHAMLIFVFMTLFFSIPIICSFYKLRHAFDARLQH